MRTQGPHREPIPAYLSTGEQILAALVIVAGILAITLPFQLDVSGLTLRLAVISGAFVIVTTLFVVTRVVQHRRSDPRAKPPPEVSRRRQRISSMAFLLGAVIIGLRLLFD